MVWWFLLGAAFFVLGGLLSVQPTKTQKRIAVLREEAINMGLHVKLPVSLRFPKEVEKASYPYYCKTLTNRKRAHQFAHVLRLDDGRIISSSNGNAELESQFEKRLSLLSPEYSAIYLGSGLLGISWSEASGIKVSEQLMKSLSELETTLSE